MVELPQVKPRREAWVAAAGVVLQTGLLQAPHAPLLLRAPLSAPKSPLAPQGLQVQSDLQAARGHGDGGHKVGQRQGDQQLCGREAPGVSGVHKGRGCTGMSSRLEWR